VGQAAGLVLEPNSSLKFERFPDESGTSILGEKCGWSNLVFGLRMGVGGLFLGISWVFEEVQVVLRC